MTISVAVQNTADFLVYRSGTVILFTAQTEAAKEKLDELGLEGWQYIRPDHFCIDFHVALDLAEVLSEEGFTVADDE